MAAVTQVVIVAAIRVEVSEAVKRTGVWRLRIKKPGKGSRGKVVKLLMVVAAVVMAAIREARIVNCSYKRLVCPGVFFYITRRTVEMIFRNKKFCSPFDSCFDWTLYFHCP